MNNDHTIDRLNGGKGGNCMHHLKTLGDQFAHLLNGKAQMKQNGVSVSLRRSFHVSIQGRPSHTILPVGISFESLDIHGNALNLGEITLLEEEIPKFTKMIVEQGLLVGALHNHWIYTQPHLMYIHVQSVEPPLTFARKIANSFTTLSSYPIPENN
jgi:hypothetical protein